jgi:hypothetical protein
VLAAKGTTASLLVALAVQVPGPPSGRSVEARCDEGQSLQDVINRASIGTAIRVFGVCNENVTIPRSKTALTLTGGSTDAELLGRIATSSVVDVQATGVSIENLRVSGPGVAFPGETRGVGISVLNGASAWISHSVISNNNASGVRVVAAEAVLTGTRITANILGGHPGSAGVEVLTNAVVQSLNNQIEDNNGTGLYARAQSHLVVSGGTIRRNRGDGVQLHQLSQGEFNQAAVNDNQGFGIRCFDSKLAGGQSGNGDFVANGNTAGNVQCPPFPAPGPPGPQGPPGPPGPAVTTSAVCTSPIPDGTPFGRETRCQCALPLSDHEVVNVVGPCSVSSDTGSCSSPFHGSCCVCKP